MHTWPWSESPDGGVRGQRDLRRHVRVHVRRGPRASAAPRGAGVPPSRARALSMSVTLRPHLRDRRVRVAVLGLLGTGWATAVFAAAAKRKQPFALSLALVGVVNTVLARVVLELDADVRRRERVAQRARRQRRAVASDRVDQRPLSQTEGPRVETAAPQEPRPPRRHLDYARGPRGRVRPTTCARRTQRSAGAGPHDHRTPDEDGRQNEPGSGGVMSLNGWRCQTAIPGVYQLQNGRLMRFPPRRDTIVRSAPWTRGIFIALGDQGRVVEEHETVGSHASTISSNSCTTWS